MNLAQHLDTSESGCLLRGGAVGGDLQAGGVDGHESRGRDLLEVLDEPVGQWAFCSPWKNHGEPLSASTSP